MGYGHGGDVYTEGIFKGKKLIDFSSNINPFGVPESFKEHIGEALESAVRYPDIQYRELKANIAEYLNKDFKINEEYLVLGNGASEIIDLALSCFNSVLIPVPSFSEYAESASKWRCSIEYSCLDSNMQFKYKDILKKLKNSDALIIGNPNNPCGNIIDKESFREILDYCEETGKTIIIDEAFVEFTGGSSISFLEELPKFKCLFVIRAITKSFALPGIRFGFGISSNPELSMKIKEKQNPWNINCFAATAVKYIFKDEEYINVSRQWIKEQREVLSTALKTISFIDRVYKTNSNFILCRLKGTDCGKLHELCLQRGILIRRAENFTGLDSAFVRLAIKDKNSNEILINNLKEIEAGFLK